MRLLALFLGALSVVSSALAGCATVGSKILGTPHPQDWQAPHDFFHQIEQAAPCDHEVTIIPAGAPVGRPYSELSNLSSTCSPGSPTICERRLTERACALGADALLFAESSPGPTPAGASAQALTSQNARAVKWKP